MNLAASGRNCWISICSPISLHFLYLNGLLTAAAKVKGIFAHFIALTVYWPFFERKEAQGRRVESIRGSRSLYL